MTWTDGPATWKQLKYLRAHGYTPTPAHRLTKSEASELIRSFGGQPEGPAPLAEKQAQPALADARQPVAVGSTERAKEALNAGPTQRQEFWLDTCREVMRVGSMQARELYRKHGCLFCEPTGQQVQEILDALDSALPSWDKDHPELFYETLGLNFPGLRRRR